MKDVVEETKKLIINEEKQELYEMARIGFTEDGFEVYVNTDDGGNIPHFHYRTRGTWEFHSCIRLDRADYFEHEGKEGKLNSSQRKNLVKFLKAKNKSSKFDSNWERLVADWNSNNSDISIDEDIQMPDYTKLPSK